MIYLSWIMGRLHIHQLVNHMAMGLWLPLLATKILSWLAALIGHVLVMEVMFKGIGLVF